MYKDNLIKELIKEHERVKFKYLKEEQDLELEELFETKSIYDIKPSSFYDKIKFVDDRCSGADVKLKKKLDLERIMSETRSDDWDE